MKRHAPDAEYLKPLDAGVAAALQVAQVVRVNADGTALCELEGGRKLPGVAVTPTAGSWLHVIEGDQVAVSVGRGGTMCFITGHIGKVRESLVGGDGAASARPAERGGEHLVLEAAEGITLRAGEGSITIRKDGKILIKGSDLVSHAKRMNRVKGGAVSIN